MGVRKGPCAVSRDFLIREFFELGKSIKSIAKELSVGINTLYAWYKMCNITLPRGIQKSPHPNLLGKTFGKLTAIQENILTNRVTWKCLCKCGKFKTVRDDRLLNGTTKDCGCMRPSLISKKNWRGFGEISKSHYSSYFKGARSRGIEFNVSVEYLWDLFIKQDRKCALTDLPIEFQERMSGDKKKTASLDRIDSKKGYVEGNVQWVHKHLNKIKWDFTMDELKFYSSLIHNKFNKKPDHPNENTT